MCITLLNDQPTMAVVLGLLFVVPAFILAVVLTPWLAQRIFEVITVFGGGGLRTVWKVMFASGIFLVIFLSLLLVAMTLLTVAVGVNSALYLHALVSAMVISAVISAPGLVSVVILPFVKARVSPDQPAHDADHIEVPENGT